MAVIALADRARRRRRRIIVGLFETISAVALVVSLLALRATREAARADRAAALAQEEARQARNASRMAAARELHTDPTTALALLREIEPPGVPRGWADLARSSLHGGITLVELSHPESVISAAFSPDGQRIVTASEDKTVRVWADLVELHGTNDLRLWTTTPYCLSIERRIELLNVSEAAARADQEACQRRARAAASGSY